MSDKTDETETDNSPPPDSAASRVLGISGTFPTPAAKPPSRVSVRWQGPGTMAFAGGKAAGGPTVTVDNNGKLGPGPVDTLLIALAACTSEDVLTILAKRRTPATGLRVEVTGTRAAAIPARLTHIQLHYVVEGDGVERDHALRAIELAVTKYCSVRDSLDKDIPVDWSVELAGADGAAGSGR